MYTRIQDMRSEDIKHATQWLWRIATLEEPDAEGYSPCYLVVLCGDCNLIMQGADEGGTIVCECGSVHHAPADQDQLMSYCDTVDPHPSSYPAYA